MQDGSRPPDSIVEHLRRPVAVVVVLVVLLLAADLINSYAWLWVGLFGAIGIFAHVRYASYALLVIGAFLTGSAVGILLEATFNFTGAYLSSAGTAVAMVDFVSPRPGRIAFWIGAAAVVLGVALGLAEAGARAWWLLCLLAACVGGYLALRRL